MTGSNEKPCIALLMTGNELITGERTDTNSVFMAGLLAEAGAVVTRKIVIGDRLDVLTGTLDTLSRECDVVIVNGGMGSTVDDLTAEVAASVSGKKLIEHPTAVEHISRRYGVKVLSEASRFYAQIKKQALIPESAELLDNPVGLALGFKLKINRADCYFTPGVPRELHQMFQQSILPDIRRNFSLSTGHRTLRFNIAGIGESQVQQLINRQVPEAIRDRIQIGFRAHLSSVELKMTIYDAADEPALREMRDQVQLVLSDNIFSESESLPEALINLLRQQGKRVSLAESCTGGLIASQLTAVPGASDVFEAGIVSYSNRSKQLLLGVSNEDLEKHGAVSREIAVAMVEGVLKRTGVDIAAAVTGIAGPTGGTDDKPVGTVFLAWGTHGDVHTRLMQLKRDRELFQLLVASAAQDILRRYLLGLDTNSIYYFDEISRKRL